MLAAIDFSDGARRALEEARQLARRAGMELHVIHVALPGGTWKPDSKCADWLRSASVSPNSVFVRRGLAWVELVRHANEIAAAMLVLGSHGASGIQGMRLGSTASRVAVSATCPVLLVSGRSERTVDADASR